MSVEVLDQVIDLASELGYAWDSLQGELADAEQVFMEAIKTTKANRYSPSRHGEWGDIFEVLSQMTSLRSGFEIQCRRLRQVALLVECREVVEERDARLAKADGGA
ncbi:hypothetical protein LCGC14_2881630 [marine sediment metagenome]|uniref:Uncharacterized protein n=1 Tax=marine sediment metagenome TaxID=412755 RepID=A0A0F9A7W9_9ZZZZ